MKRMTNNKYFYGFILTLFALLFLVGGIVLKTVAKEEARKEAKMIEFRNSFMEGCMGEEAPFEYCDCVYDFLLRAKGDEGFVDMALEYSETKEFPQDMDKAIKACI